jgi:hypothetical protein
VLSFSAVAGSAQHGKQVLGHHGRLPWLQRRDVVNGQVSGRLACEAPRELFAHLTAQLAPSRVSVGAAPNWPVSLTLSLRHDLIGAGLATVADALQDAAGQARTGEA